MITRLSILMILLLAAAQLQAHPMSDIYVEVTKVDNGIVMVYRHSLVDMLETEQLPFEDQEVIDYPEAVLRSTLAAYHQRVTNGLVVYRNNGQILRGTIVKTSGDIPLGPLRYEVLSGHVFELHLHFPSTTARELETVSFDFGNWRLGISTIITCSYQNIPSLTRPILWDEGGLYPLFPELPEIDQAKKIGTQGVMAIPSLNSRGIGFSTVSMEDDHFRHELLLPVNTALSLVEWNDDAPQQESQPQQPGRQPAAHSTLNLMQQQLIAEALLHHGETSNFARLQPQADDHGRVIIPQTRRVSWFDRSSLRRGLALENQAIPVATGFIGLIEIYRPQAAKQGNTNQITIDHKRWRQLAYNLTFTARDGDDIIIRKTGRELRETWQFNQAPADVSAIVFDQPETQTHYWWWCLVGISGLFALLSLISQQGIRRRIYVTLCCGGIIGIIMIHPESTTEFNHQRIEAQLRQAYDSASGNDERRSLQALQAICTPALAAQLHIESRRQLGPWRVRSGLDIETITLEAVSPVNATTARAQWSVRCRIRHWGHGHNRVVHFDGLLAFAADGRLAQIELLDKQLTEADSAKLNNS